MASINLANVAIGFDISKIQKGMELTRAEMRSVSKIVQDSVSPVDQYNMKMADLRKAYDAGAISAKRFAEAQDHLKQKYLEVGVAASSNSATTSASITTMIGRYASLAAAGAMLKNSFSLASTAESTKMTLEVLTGSAEKASRLFNDFRRLDAESPLSKTDYAKAAQTLIGYGYSTEYTTKALSNLGQVAVGNAEKFQSLVLAFGQVQANGRLMGGEVNQMVNAGFNPLQEIARTTGRSMIDLKKAMEAGAISAKMVEDAFASATEVGGRFYGMNEKLAGTASTQFSKLQADAESLSTQIGTNLLPAAKAFMAVMSSGSDLSGKNGLASRWSTTIGDGLETWVHLLSLNIDGLAKQHERVRSEVIKGELESQYLHTNTAEDMRRIALREQIELEKTQLEQAKEAENQALEQSRIAKEKADQLLAAEKQLTQEKLRQKEIEEKKREQVREIGTLIDDGPGRLADEYKKYVERLNEYAMAGAISQSEYDRGMSQAGKRFQDDTKRRENPDNISSTIAPSIKAGSVEAYKYLLSQRDKLADQSQVQIDLQKEIVQISKQQLSELEEANNEQRVYVSLGRR